MRHHPHIHNIVPAIANAPKTDKLLHPKAKSRGAQPFTRTDQFLCHFAPLAARFRSLIQSTLKTEPPHIYQNLTPDLQHALNPSTKWKVQLQPVGRGKTVLR